MTVALFLSFLLFLLGPPPASVHPHCVALEYRCETDAEASVSTNAAMSLDELVFVFERRLTPEVAVRARWRDFFFQFFNEKQLRLADFLHLPYFPTSHQSPAECFPWFNDLLVDLVMSMTAVSLSLRPASVATCRCWVFQVMPVYQGQVLTCVLTRGGRVSLCRHVRVPPISWLCFNTCTWITLLWNLTSLKTFFVYICTLILFTVQKR